MTRSLWWSSSGRFAADESGLYPQARQVVAHFRRLAGWSRETLAARLKLGPKMVYRLEREGCGLDSLARLRELQVLLEIPPELLGLCLAPGPAGWWVSEYEPWLSTPDGWPDAGAVVKYYRRARSWTQAQLADALGVTELTVRSMENQHAGLDSITRRRALRFLLAIPPVLLGLDSEHIAKEFGGVLIGSTKTPSPELIASFRSAANALFAGYYAGHAQDKVDDTLAWLSQVREVSSMVHGSQRSQVLEAESLGYQALANITREYAPDTQVFSYANRGVQLARASNNSDLLVVALQRRAETLIVRGHVDLAQRSINEALLSSPDDESLLICRYVASARVLSAVASDEQERSAVFALLDQSRPVTVQDTFSLHCDSEIVTIRTAQSYNLLAVHAPQQQSRDLLRKSSDLLIDLSPDTARRAMLAKLALAESFIGLKELDSAATLAIEAISLMDQIKSSAYLPQLAALYRRLRKSTLRDDPSVARIGLYLHEHGSL